MSELDELAQARETTSAYRGPVRRAEPTSSPMAFGMLAALGAAPILFVVIVLAVLASAEIMKKRMQWQMEDAVQRIEDARIAK